MKTVPKLALGTWLMGGAGEPNPNNDDDVDKAAILLAISNDIILIDTAQSYARGRSEELVGEALVGRPRNSYEILTKQRLDRLGYNDVMEDFEQSLLRLKVNYIDYFVCHAPNATFDMRDFFRASNKLYEDGKIKNVGVSNFGPNMLKLAVKISKIPISLNQVHVSLDDDDVFATGTYRFCVENGIVVQAYRTLANLGVNKGAYKMLKSIADKRGISVQQVAVAYINSYPGMAFTIKASTLKHWQEIKEALNLKLDDSEINQLRAAHKNVNGSFRQYLDL